MDCSTLSTCAVLEVFVVLFQVMGVLTLAFSRLIPSWGIFVRVGFVVAAPTAAVATSIPNFDQRG